MRGRAARRRLPRRNLRDSRGVICLTASGAATLFDQAGHQVGELQQIGHAIQRAPPAKDKLGVSRHDVGPLRWHRADVVAVDTEQQPRPVAIVPLADAGELQSAERVKRVGDAHKARAWVRRASSSC